MQEKIKKIRLAIDKIDEKILKLLRKRAFNVDKIAQLKAKNNMPVTDTDREKDILSKTKNKSEEEIFKKILEKSKNQQNKALL
ncbi:chorismate mutase [Candidatus Peregrinibacteria bacterium]|nr:chorismate mutase [Candidatus Peregrinibacteria bacterium]